MFSSRTTHAWLGSVGPGLLLCAGISLAAWGISAVQGLVLGQVPIDSYVGAILLGLGLRTACHFSDRFEPGLRLGGKGFLEVGVGLLGASLSAQLLASVSAAMVAGIALLVVTAVACGYGIGRAVGLSPRLSILIACGNSICGNSAIAAVAPVIEADAREIASAITFTAIWGVPIVIVLPVLATWLGVGPHAYGAFAGLTIYSVPQVLAATLPLGAIATQVGMLTKLVRIVLLAPVVLVLAIIFRVRHAAHVPIRFLPPWFIFVFFGLASLRSFGLIPEDVAHGASVASGVFNLIAMAALGLSVDARLLLNSGGRISAATLASMVLLGCLSLGLVQLMASLSP